MSEWRKYIRGSEERKVFEALDNPKWDFRTIKGIARETRIGSGKVREIINRYPEFIIKVTGPSSEYLFTSKGNKFKKSIHGRIIDAIAKRW